MIYIFYFVLALSRVPESRIEITPEYMMKLRIIHIYKIQKHLLSFYALHSSVSPILV